MKRSTKLALALALSAVMVTPAIAQDNFPDVPANHWAYEALARAKRDGLLVGYPDGKFRGPRPASRYELAVALHAVYTNLKSAIDGLDGQIAALKGNTGAGNSDEVKALRDALAALQSDVAALKGYGDDIANLKKAADEFEKVYKSLGIDVEALKKDLGSLEERVKRLEGKKPSIEISGDVNLWVGAGNSRDNRPGLTIDGRIIGHDNGAPVGLSRDNSILHEGAFTFKGTNESGPQFKGTIVYGNMLGAAGAAGNAFGNQSTLAGNVVGGNVTSYGEGLGDAYIQELGVKFKSSIGGLGFDAEIGRIGLGGSAYTLRRLDNTTYFENSRWDNGLYTFDGAKLAFNFGGAKLGVFAGKNSARLSTNGFDINPLVIAAGGRTAVTDAAASTIDRSAGAMLNLPLGKVANLNLEYLWLENNANNGLAVGGATGNRLAVFGGTVTGNVGKIGVEGTFNQSNLQQGETNVVDEDNQLYGGKLSYGTTKWGLSAGYFVVGANYAAPGDWGRVAILRNPTNVKGFVGGGHYDISSALKLTFGGQFWEGNENGFNFTGFNENTEIRAFNAGLSYALNPNLTVFGSYESTEIEGLVGATNTAKYRFTTVGFSHGLSSTAKLSLQYQLSDVSNEAFLGSVGAGNRFTGGFLTTQLTVKF